MSFLRTIRALRNLDTRRLARRVAFPLGMAALFALQFVAFFVLAYMLIHLEAG